MSEFTSWLFVNFEPYDFSKKKVDMITSRPYN